MIMRIFQVSTHPGKEAAFSAFFHDVAIPLIPRTEGLVTVLPGAALPKTPTEFGFAMVWRDLDALKAFAEEDYCTPHIAPEEAELVAARSIMHYDLADA